MSTLFQFPTVGIDVFDPTLVDDVTVVSAAHVNDLRKSVVEVEKSIIGITALPYTNTSIISSGDNLRDALQKLDIYTTALANQINFVFDGYFDGYASRIDALEGEFKAHREESYMLDSYGYNVHGVDGYVVGTNNTQALLNKTLDTGTSFVGPKIITRSNPGDAGEHQIEIYSFDGYLKAWIDEQGNAKFTNLILDGYREIQGVDIIKNSLFVDGYSILGNSLSDYTSVAGDLLVAGSTTLQEDLSVQGSNVDMGDSTGLLTLDFTQSTMSGSLVIAGTLSVSGPTNFGDLSGSDPVTIKGPIYHTVGSFYNTDGFRALGNQFRVESATTFIDTNALTIGSLTITSKTLSLNEDENTRSFSSDGYYYSFGRYSSKSTNLFIVNSTALFEDDISTNGNLTINLGYSLSASQAYLDNLKLGTSTTQGYVWTSSDNAGNGQWMPTQATWDTKTMDGYTYTDSTGTYPQVVSNTFASQVGQELFISTVLAPFTVFLPATTIGKRVRVVDFDGSWGANPVTIIPNGTDLVESNTSLVLSAPNTWCELVCVGSNWKKLT